MDSHQPAQRILRDAETISSARLRRSFDYWTTLKGERFAPARGELNPAEMREQLGWIWLMDVLDGGADFRFRMGGDRVIQFFGQRLAGSTIKSVAPVAPAFFGRFTDLAQLATRTRAPVIAGPAPTQYEPRAFLEVEVILLPLSDDGEAVSNLMGNIEIRPLAKALEPRD